VQTNPTAEQNKKTHYMGQIVCGISPVLL